MAQIQGQPMSLGEPGMQNKTQSQNKQSNKAINDKTLCIYIKCAKYFIQVHLNKKS